jgi:cell division protein FtsW
VADRKYTVARQAESTARQLEWDDRFDEAAAEAADVPAIRRGRMDTPFLALTLILLVFGVVMILSASFARAYYTLGDPTRYFIRQTAFAGGGAALMLITSRFRVATFRRAALPLLLVSVGLLAIVPVVGTRVNGAKRWIDLGFTTFQPSEIAKLAEILIFSAMICTFKQRMRTVKYGIVPFVAVVLVFVALLYMEPHLSAIIILVAVAAIMMFAGGTRLYLFAIMGGGGALIAFIALKTLSYAGDRITAWLNPEAVASDQGYQIIQSLYAIGSGGLFGVGLGQGRQKYLYLPMEHNDYIFSICCEELGFIGAMLILSLFAMLIVRGYWLALHAGSRFGSLVVTGLTSLLALQVVLNIAVVTNMLPSTGISLPFFSYGGTALLIQLVEMGIILAISRDIPVSR